MAVKMTKKEQRELEEIQKAQKVKKTPALTEQEKLALKAEAQTNLAERRAETARNKAAAQSNVNKPVVVKNTAADRELKQQAAVQAAEKVERLSPADVARKNAELKAAKEAAQGNLQLRRNLTLARNPNFIGPIAIPARSIQELPILKNPAIDQFPNRADAFIKSSSFLSDVGSGLDYLLVDLPAKKVQEGTALPIHELLTIINTATGNIDPETGKRRNSTADQMKEQEKLAQERLMYGLTPVQKELTGLALSGADMLLGMGMAGTAGVPYAGYLAAVGGANAGQKALDEGYSAEKSAQLAAASGLASYGIEKMGGIAGDWGGKVLNKIAGTKAGTAVINSLPQKAVEYLSKASDSKVAKIFGDALSEGFEEGTEYNTQRILENLILDKDTPFDVKEAARNVAAGMIFGGVGSALGATGKEADISEKPETGNTESSPRYAIKQDINNQPFVEVEEDILAGVPRKDWEETVKKNLQQKFPNGIQIDNNLILVDRQSRKELTYSEYTKKLRRRKNVFADKMRSTDNADEIVLAAQNYKYEAPKHSRKDKIVDFARGYVNIRVGNNDYRANVIIAGRDNGEVLLYDIINLAPIKIQTNIKKPDMVWAQNLFSGTAATENPSPGTDRITISDFYDPTLTQNGVPVNPAADSLQAFFDVGKEGTLHNESSIDVDSKTAETLESLGKALGVSIVIDPAIPLQKGAANGYYANGEIHIAADADQPLLTVAKHEITHRLQETSPEGYAAFRDYARKLMTDEELQELSARYLESGQQLTEAELLDEAAATLSEKLLTDEESIKRLIRDDRNLAELIWDRIKELFRKVGEKLHLVDPSLKQAERLWEKAFHDALNEKAPAVINRVQEEINARQQAAVEGQAPEIRQSGRSREYQSRQEKIFRNRVKDIFSIPDTVALGQELDADINAAAEEIKQNGKVSRETAEALFQKAYENGQMALDDRYGEEASQFLEFAREDFENALADFAAEMQRVANVDREDALSLQRKFSQNPDGLTDQQIEELGHELNREKRKVEQVERQNLLAKGEKQVVRDFLRDGRSDFENINPVMNRKGIEAVVEASRRWYEINQILGNRRSKIREEKRIVAEGLLTNSDLWQDKATGVQYSRETAERNLRDVMKADPEGYQKIKAAIFDPIHKNEAAKQKFMNAYRERVKALKLTADESRWVQLLGEGEIDEAQIPKNLPKVKQAVEEFRKIYAELYDQVNETLVRNGYEPIEPIEGYFPHFQEEVTWLHPIKRVKQLVEDSKLPTDIAGLTHTFTPGKRWSGHLQHRDGIRTDYNAVKGLDQYLDSVADVIYHTDDIQNLRALESSIRRKYSDEATEATVDAATKTMSVEQAEQVEDALYSKLLKDKNNAGLGNFVTWIRRYTDILAGKKALIDREIEHETGRAIYKLVGDWEGQIAKNMVSTNLSSAFSNFIPIVQATGEVKNKYLAQAMADTVKSGFKSDGFEENSTFITNRKGSDKAFKTASDKVADVLSIPFEAVDTFTTNVVTRGKYLQLLDEGVDPETAMERADEFAASLMADRSVGAMPTAFSTKNPFFKLFTMFQTEVNNQFSYLFKDLPKNLKEEGQRSYAAGLMRIAIYTFLAGLGYEELTGRDPQFNPLGMIFDFVMDATDEEKGLAEAALNFGKTAVEQTPFVGGLIGGGRFPVDAGLIPFEDVYNSTVKTIRGEQSLEKWGDDLLNDVAKPASMNLFPFGANQLYKTISGVKTVAEGGLYGVQSDGSKQLKYPVDQTPGNFIKGALFGKSAFPEASAYYDSFKPVTDLDVSGTRLGKLKSRIPEDTLDLFGLKGKEQPTADSGRDIVREAKSAALASVIKYTQRDKNGEAVLDENGDPVKNTVQLSPDEKREYQRRYEALLPKDMTGLSDEVRNKIFNFAEDAAALEVLGSDYDPGSGVKKALQAMEAGVDIATYFELQHEMAQFEPQKLRDGKEITTTQQKRSLLLNDDRLNSQQKSKLDKLLIQTSDEKKEINYENANTVAASLLSESQQKRYSGVTAAFGGNVTVAQYEGYAKTINDAKADKDQWGDSIAGTAKANAIAALQRQGLSLAKAHEVYALVKGGVPTDTSNKTAALLSTMDDNEQARYKAAKSYFSSMTPTDYLVYSDAISSANAGSYSEKINALKNYGFTEMQAAVFIGCNEVSKKTDLSDPNRIIYQTFTDSQKEKFERVTASPTFAKMREYDFYYFYKMMGSGKKAEKLSALRNAGLSAAQAEAFYKLAG